MQDEITPEEKTWPFKDPKAQKSINKGLKEAEEYKLHIVDSAEFDMPD